MRIIHTVNMQCVAIVAHPLAQHRGTADHLNPWYSTTVLLHVHVYIQSEVQCGYVR